MKKKIINNRTGASLINVILALTLVSALAMFVSSQVINQIKSTSKRTNEIQLQYTSEAGIERTIEELISKVKNNESTYSVSSSKLRSAQSSYLDLIQQEIEDIIKIDSVNTDELERAINDIDYNSDIDSIILKLSDVRTELLNIIKDNTSERSKIKDTVDFNISKVCKAIDYANAEKNKNVEPIEFIDMSDPDGFQKYKINLDYIIGNNKDAYGNTLVLMWNYIDSIISKTKDLHGFTKNNNNNNDSEAKDIDKLVKLSENMVSIVQGLHSEMNGIYAPIFGVYNPDKDTQERILKKAEEKLKELEVIIDTIITSARGSREEVYKVYTYYMANNYIKIDKEYEFKILIDEILKMYDSIEDQLRWFKKKINLFGSNDDSTDSPDTELPDDSNDDSTNNPDTEIPGEDDSDIDYIILEVYKDEFEVMNSIYEYEVKYEKDGEIVDEIRIPKNIQEYNLNIVSTATNNNKTYKIRATIILNLENGIQYSVDEYKRINY